MGMRNKTRYNAVKQRALEIFANQKDWMDVQTWAQLTGIRPTRRAYTYLIRLARFGLVERTKDSAGRLVYRITQRGRDRLEWLAVVR